MIKKGGVERIRGSKGEKIPGKLLHVEKSYSGSGGSSVSRWEASTKENGKISALKEAGAECHKVIIPFLAADGRQDKKMKIRLKSRVLALSLPLNTGEKRRLKD